jgi:hypothetical protein
MNKYDSIAKERTKTIESNKRITDMSNKPLTKDNANNKRDNVP